MVFEKLRGVARRRAADSSDVVDNGEEFLEVSVMDTGSPAAVTAGGKIGIVIENLGEFADTEKVLRALRDGTIVFLKIKNLKEKDLGELKRAVERLKKTVMAQNGDIAGVEQDWLILTPEHAMVHRD